MDHKAEVLAQVVLPSTALTEDINFFTQLGFRLDQIFPADDPAVAVMSGHGLHLRINRDATCSPPCIHLLTDHPEDIAEEKAELHAPNGTMVKILPRSFQLNMPTTQHKFEVRQLQDQDPWVIGRAGCTAT